MKKYSYFRASLSSWHTGSNFRDMKNMPRNAVHFQKKKTCLAFAPQRGPVLVMLFWWHEKMDRVERHFSFFWRLNSKKICLSCFELIPEISLVKIFASHSPHNAVQFSCHENSSQYLGTTLLSTLMTLQRHWHNFLMFSFHSPSPWIGFQKGTAKKKWSKIWSCSPLWHAPEMRPKSYIHVICLSTGFCAKRANIEIGITLASNPLFASLLEWVNVSRCEIPHFHVVIFARIWLTRKYGEDE